MNSETGIIMTNLMFDPLDRHYDLDDPQDPSRRVYTCEAFIGNRFQENARSKGIQLSTLCKRLNELHASTVHVHCIMKYSIHVKCNFSHVHSCIQLYVCEDVKTHLPVTHKHLPILVKLN